MIGSVAMNLGIRPSTILRSVEEDGLLDLLFDVQVLSEAMPKTEDSLTSEIEQKYRGMGIR